MKFIITLVAAAALSACALTVEQKQALADAAIAQVQSLNAAGIDPVSLPPEQLTLLASGCALIPLAYPDMSADIVSVCAVVAEAAK